MKQANNQAKEKNKTQQTLTTSNPPPSLDDTDRKLLQELQDNFPLVERPWQEISKSLGISEKEVMQRLQRLSNSGVFRKIGAIVDSSKMGFTAATLVALQVPEKEITTVAEVINQYPNVSHNYERQHEYNVWFTLTTRTPREITEILDEITKKIGIQPQAVLNLPTEQRFKINVSFQLSKSA